MIGITAGSAVTSPFAALMTYRFNVGVGEDAGNLLNPSLHATLAGVDMTIASPQVSSAFGQASVAGTLRVSSQRLSLWPAVRRGARQRDAGRHHRRRSRPLLRRPLGNSPRPHRRGLFLATPRRMARVRRADLFGPTTAKPSGECLSPGAVSRGWAAFKYRMTWMRGLWSRCLLMKSFKIRGRSTPYI